MDYSTVNVNILGNKAKTKNEIYRLLTVEAQLTSHLKKNDLSTLWGTSFEIKRRYYLNLW